MNRILTYLLPLLAGALFGASCASDAGQLTASEIDPVVQVVTGDLEQYLDAGIAPDGSQLSTEDLHELRGPLVVLRNYFHQAAERPLETLPKLTPVVPDPTDTVPKQVEDVPRVR